MVWSSRETRKHTGTEQLLPRERWIFSKAVLDSIENLQVAPVSEVFGPRKKILKRYLTNPKQYKGANWVGDGKKPGPVQKPEKAVP